MARGMRGGMDPRMMKKLQKQMKSEELEVIEVVMKLADRTLVFKAPAVTCTEIMGQTTYQIIGSPEEAAPQGEGEDAGPVIPIEDIKLVADRAGVSDAEARKALQENDGDIAEAIISLM